MLKNFLQSIWFYLALLIVLTIPLCSGLFGSDLISGHDSMAGLIRALSMEKYMGHGQFLVRWAPEINWGYGYPMFNFYPPFFSFVSVLFFQLTQNMVWAINLACSFFWILSAIGMFLWAREYWGDEGGMLSAILYTYAPYHITDLYVRGAFAEFSAFAFFPFLLLSILKISRQPKPGWDLLLGIGSVFGLSLTHNIMSMLFFPIAGLYIIYLFFYEKRSSWILMAIGAFVIGLMISSFFWLPAFTEKTFLNLNFLISMRYDFHKSFVTLGELFWPFNKFTMNGISFQVGIVHSVLCLGTLFSLQRIYKINKQLGSTCIFFLSVGLAAIFLTLPYSQLLWEHINILKFTQLPWRLLAIIIFAMSFLGGSVGVLIKKTTMRRTFLITAALLAIFIYLKSSPKPVFVSSEQSIQGFIALGEGEYTPKWVMVPPHGRPNEKFEIVQGKCKLGDEKSLNPVEYEAKILALEPSLLCFHTFYFPGWQVNIDGQATPPYINNPFGLILFRVPPGEHDIQVLFGTTPVRFAGMIISWLGIFLLFIGIFFFREKLI